MTTAIIQVEEAQAITELRELRKQAERSAKEIGEELFRWQERLEGSFKKAYNAAGWTEDKVYYYLRVYKNQLVTVEESQPQVIDSTKPDAMAVHYSSDSAEWYTPPEIIERTTKAIGTIDLDPCSPTSPTIPAATTFTKEANGLRFDWCGNVYMNPPYGREIGEWVTKLVTEHREGRTKEAIALVPARVDTDWFRQFRDFAICFIDGRLKFSGHDNSAPFPSAVVYLGSNLDRFSDSFGDIGDVWVRWRK